MKEGDSCERGRGVGLAGGLTGKGGRKVSEQVRMVAEERGEGGNGRGAVGGA